jgi:hypothetical protein
MYSLVFSSSFFILPPFLHRSKNVTVPRFEDGAALAVCSGGVDGRRRRGDHHSRHASPRAQDVIRWRICLFPPDTALGENISWLHPASLNCTRSSVVHRSLHAWPLLILAAASPLTTHHTPLISRTSAKSSSVLRSPFTTHHSPLTTCRSSLTHWCCTHFSEHTTHH